jgi:hypothetical protein
MFIVIIVNVAMVSVMAPKINKKQYRSYFKLFFALSTILEYLFKFECFSFLLHHKKRNIDFYRFLIQSILPLDCTVWQD